MIDISGYRVRHEQGLCCDSEDFVINSCGHYRLLTREKFLTSRPAGREDYQLLYLYRGQARFLIKGRRIQAQEGSAVLYTPGEPQWYEYTRSDTPDVYWIHFSGRRAHRILAAAGLGESGVYRVGTQGKFSALLDGVIRELQIQRPCYLELSSLYVQELLALFSRARQEDTAPDRTPNGDVERAVRYFNQAFNRPICIQTYAQGCNITPCWFIRSFKRQMGVTPQRYLTGIRMNKARELLAGSTYNVSEIAGLVGYPNPLYFSRVFSQTQGCSPTEFRRQHRGVEQAPRRMETDQPALPARFQSYLKD